MKPEQNKNMEKFLELLKEAKVCMFITNAGNISGRPMIINKIDDDRTMWFFARVLSRKVYEIDENKKISLVTMNEKTNNYLMINGTATLSDDRNKMKELWNTNIKMWFPEEIDDPDLVLIKVIPNEVSYWDNNSNKMVTIYHLHRSIVQSNKYERV
jgi:general stress protein 26